MQDFMVGICVAAALVFVARTLWNKAGSQKSGGGCCGCSGCANRSPLRDGSCANADKGPGGLGQKLGNELGSKRAGEQTCATAEEHRP